MTESLLIDTVGAAEIYLNESTSNGLTKFRGKFQEANAINKNKRMYPFEVLNLNLERLIDTVTSRGLVGECDHASDSIVHLERASHLITKLWFEGNVMMGEGEILPTPHGMILKKLLESGVRVGISSRGVGNGNVNSEGTLVIGESYKLITFDIVADPSTDGAFQKIITNSKHENAIYTQKSQTKNETTNIYNVNGDALTAYVGKLVESKVNKIKKERFK